MAAQGSLEKLGLPQDRTRGESRPGTPTIFVTGSAQARPETLNEMLKISVEHVHLSRLEPGCIFHAVSQDVEDKLRLVFVEKWVDQAAIKAHFAVPESRAFGKALIKLAALPPQMEVFEAQPVPFA